MDKRKTNVAQLTRQGKGRGFGKECIEGYISRKNFEEMKARESKSRGKNLFERIHLPCALSCALP